MVGPIFSKAKVDTFDKMTRGKPQYFLDQKLEGGGTEIQLPTGLDIYALVIYEAWNDTFLIIRPPKKPLSWPKFAIWPIASSSRYS